MTNQTGEPPTVLHFDTTLDVRTYQCDDCDRPFRAHVAPYRYPSGDIEGGRWICTNCLTAISPGLAAAAEALDVIALAAEEDVDILARAAQAISAMRRTSEAHQHEAAVTAFYGRSMPQPAIVQVGHTPIGDGGELYVSGELRNGQPRIAITDNGGYAYLDDEADAVEQVIERIRDMAAVTRLAADIDTIPTVGTPPADMASDPDDEPGSADDPPGH